MFLTVIQKIYFSRKNDPEYFKELFFLQIFITTKLNLSAKQSRAKQDAWAWSLMAQEFNLLLSKHFQPTQGKKMKNKFKNNKTRIAFI